jgi:shikimate kinase
VKIALAGFMAVGKSTIGRILAQKLGLMFVDLDLEIENLGQSIPELFALGERHFREKEHEMLLQWRDASDIVLALGGGSLHFGTTSQWIEDYFQVYTLQTSWESLEKRILFSNRPLGIDAKVLFERRHKLYSQIGQQIDVELKSPQEITDIIMERIKC